MAEMNPQSIHQKPHGARSLREALEGRWPFVAAVSSTLAAVVAVGIFLHPTNVFGGIAHGFADQRMASDIKADVAKLEARFDKFEGRLETRFDRMEGKIEDLARTVAVVNTAQIRTAERLDAHIRDQQLFFRPPDASEVPRIVKPKARVKTDTSKPNESMRTGMKGAEGY